MNYIPLVLSSGHGFCSVSLCSAPVTRLLCWWSGICIILGLFLWGWFFVFSVLFLPFCFRSLFLDLCTRFKFTSVKPLKNIPCLQGQVVMHWETNEREDVTQRLFKGCFRGTEKRAVSFMFPSPEPPNTWVSCVSKHFPVKRGVRAMLSGGFVLLSVEQDNISVVEGFGAITSLLLSGPWVEFLFEPRPS